MINFIKLIRVTKVLKLTNRIDSKIEENKKDNVQNLKIFLKMVNNVRNVRNVHDEEKTYILQKPKNHFAPLVTINSNYPKDVSETVNHNKIIININENFTNKNSENKYLANYHYDSRVVNYSKSYFQTENVKKDILLNTNSNSDSHNNNKYNKKPLDNDGKTQGEIELDCLQYDFNLEMEEFSRGSKNLVLYPRENKNMLRSKDKFEADDDRVSVSNNENNYDYDNYCDEFLPENRQFKIKAVGSKIFNSEEIKKDINDYSNNYSNKPVYIYDLNFDYENNFKKFEKNREQKKEEVSHILSGKEAYNNSVSNLFNIDHENNKFNCNNADYYNNKFSFEKQLLENKILCDKNCYKTIDQYYNNSCPNISKDLISNLYELKEKEEISFRRRNSNILPKASFTQNIQNKFKTYFRRENRKKNLEEISFSITNNNIKKENLLSEKRKTSKSVYKHISKNTKVYNNSNNTEPYLINNYITNNTNHKETNLDSNQRSCKIQSSEAIMIPETNDTLKTSSRTPEPLNKKQNLKLDKKLTRNFTNRLVIIINLIIVTLTIVDLDFIFEIVHPLNEQPNFHFICLDLMYLYMNLTVHNPEKYFQSFNTTVETCLYSKPYLLNYPSERNQVNLMPENLEFFMWINFTHLQIFDNFNNKTNNFFFQNKIWELNGTTEYLGSLRESQDYYVERYYFADEDYVTFYSYKRHLTRLTHTLDMLKAIFVAFILIYGNLLFTSDINFYIISPIENIFKRLNLIFKAIDIVKIEKMKEEEYLNFSNKDVNDGNLSHEEDSSLLNIELEKEKSKLKKPKGKLFSRITPKITGKHEEKKNFLNIENRMKSAYEMILGKKNLEKIINEELKRRNSACVVGVIEQLNKLNTISEKKKEKKKQKMLKNSKEELEINKIDFSLIRLLNMVSTILGNPVLLVIPNCDLENNLKLNFKSSAVEFEGFVLMLKFTGVETLFEKMGAKGAEYLNKTLMLFHAIGVLFMAEPYKTDDFEILIWRKNRNRWTENISKYINGLSKFYL